MAMNKAEKAAFEKALTAYSLRWTAETLPDIPPPPLDAPFGELTQGFAIRGALGDYPNIEKSCSSNTSHALGNTQKTTTQRSIWLYSSRLLALKGLRNQVESACASKLRSIDRMIEHEEANKSRMIKG